MKGRGHRRFKRKARGAGSLKRAGAKRASYDVVLIVCEGEKTEPNYFKGLRNELRLTNTNIIICGRECGSSPDAVVDFAIAKYQQTRDYDRVYCVFDKDTHSTYIAALDRIRRTRLPNQGKIFAIPSVPCFEYWLLLHFIFTTRPFAKSGAGSSCDSVIKELTKFLPHYGKSHGRIFQETRRLMDAAITNAKRVAKFHETSGADNPSTQVHELVEYLCNIKLQS